MKSLKHYLSLFILFSFVLPVVAATSKSIRIQVTNGTYTDEALIGFYTAALDTYDAYDSHKISNENAAYPEIFFMASGEEVAINGLPSLIANKTLALGFRTGTAGSFTIRISEFNNLDAGTTVLLKDNLLSVEQYLTLGSSYTFTSAISTNSTRFTLVITKPLAKVVASDRSLSDKFGSAVAVCGDYAVVGNNPADSSGAVYLFKYTSGTWSQIQKITSSDIASNDHFGSSVALNNDYLVVGAIGEDEDVLGGNALSTAGSAYVFKNEAGTWSQVQKLVASDRSAGAYFGHSVSVSGSHLVVGAVNDDGYAGAAYIFNNAAGNWSQVQKITASDKISGDHFGRSVSISGKTLIIGAIDEDEDAAGNNSLTSAGSAYVFQNTAGTWSQVQKLVASDRAAMDKFGCSVALSGEYAVVGASDEDEDAAGANTASSTGSAYLFKNIAGTWTHVQKIVASDRAADDHFGSSVSASGSYLLIGGNTLSAAGSAYLFKNSAGTWSQNQKISAADQEANDQFGFSVGFSGKNGIIGNPNDSHDATGINSLTSAGSASFFRLDPPKRTWNGTSWGTAPTASDSAIINGTYNGAGFSCMDLVVNAGKKLSVTSDLNVYGNMTLKSDEINGKATFMDNSHSVFVATAVQVEQYLTGAGGSSTTGRFWYLSSPLTDATSSSFDLSSSNPLNKLWSYSEPTASYTQITSTQYLNPGNGYVARLGANKTVLLTGTELNTGDQSIQVSRTGTTNVKRGYNLVGNPYPSFVELDTADNPTLERSIWYRSLTASGTSMAFDTYNLTSNSAVVASGSGALSQFIPPMQGFWVKKTTEGAVNVVFRNVKRSQQTGVTLRSAETEVLRIQLTDGKVTDETLIGFYPEAKNAFDPFDSHKISNENALFPELFTLAGMEEVAINGLQPVKSDMELPLGFRTGKSGHFTLKTSENTTREATIILYDKLLNIHQNLTQNPSYTFQSDIANTTDRFSLLFQKVATNLMSNQLGSFDVIGSKDNRIHVLLSGLDISEVRITVYDALGKKVTENPSNQHFQPGIYLVKVTSENFSGQKKVLMGH